MAVEQGTVRFGASAKNLSLKIPICLMKLMIQRPPKFKEQVLKLLEQQIPFWFYIIKQIVTTHMIIWLV
jgi:hypothetical protein